MNINGKHAFINQEKGPNDHPGITVRVLERNSRALHGFAMIPVDFWISADAFHRDETGFSGFRKSDPELQSIIIHESSEKALEAAKNEELV